MIKNVKNTVPWTYCILLMLLTVKFRVEKVIKTKGDKLHVKGKGYNNYFNSWIYRNDMV